MTEKNTTIDTYLQKWVSIDNQLKILGEKIKTLREQRGEITDFVFSAIEQKKMPSSAIQTNEVKLRFIQTKMYSPLTFQYVESSLREIIHNDSQVKQIMHHLKTNRREKIVKEIKRQG